MIAPTGKDPEHSDTDEDLSDDDTPMEEQERKEELDTEVRPPRVPRSDGAATPTDGADADAEEGEEDDGPKSLPSPHISFGTETSVTMTAWNVWSLPNKFAPFKECLLYEIQFRVMSDGHQEVDEPSFRGTDTDGASEWQPIANPHTGHNPAWVVKGLPSGKAVQFRFRFSEGPQGPDTEFSPPSRAFWIGLANYSPVGTGIGDEKKFTDAEMALFETLDTPAKIQDWLDLFPMNHEIVDDTCLSPLEALRQNHGHCIEGAMLGAYILSLHGYAPLLCDLRACARDDDHDVAVFQHKKNGLWGCISISNHSSLRWRNPVYRTIREMMMTFFDDYMNNDGCRTLRSYSKPVSVR